MAVFNGQRADQETFNNAFLSRTQDSDTVAIVGLNHPTSGGLIANAQQKINDNTTEIQSNDADIIVLQNTKQDITEKDQPGGYVGIDVVTGKMDLQFLPNQAVVRQGNYDASTNTPVIADGDAFDPGDQFYVETAGTQDLGSGPIVFAVGDTVTKNASGIWQKQNFAGANLIGDLIDVDTTTNPPTSDSEFLGYDTATMKWIPKVVQSQENFTWLGQGQATWDATSGDLVLDTDCYLSIPGMDKENHTILAQTISMPTNDTVAFITVDRAATTATNRAVTVISLNTFVNDGNNIVLATRINDEVFLGIHNPQRFQDGDEFDISKGGGGFSDAFAATDWEAYTPSVGAGTPGSTFFNFRRIGDSVQIQGQFLPSGSGTSAALSFSLPTGLVIDSAKYIGNISNTNGAGFWLDAGAAGKSIYPELLTSTSIGLRKEDVTGALLTGSNVAGSDRVSFSCQFPIVGWESTNAVGNAELTQTTAKTYTHLKVPTGVITNGFRVAIFGSVDHDPFNLYNTSTGEWTAPRTGIIDASAYLEYTVSPNALSTMGVEILNVTQNTRIRGRHNKSSAGSNAVRCSGLLKVNEGDIVQVMGFAFPVSPGSSYTANFEGSGFSFAYQPDFSTFGVINPEAGFLAAESSEKIAGPNSTWLQMVGNSVPLEPGSWLLAGVIGFSRNTNPGYFTQIGKWALSNGSDTLTEPPAPTFDAGTQANGRIQISRGSSRVVDSDLTMSTVRVTVAVATDLFLVPFYSADTPANTRIKTYIYAQRLS